ncbi:MAG TPA: ROK family protein [Sediminibacterium sp.]|nr:ROK family protein [Sediminibacterium sp.]
MIKHTVLGIDMGATNIRAGVVADGKIAACHSIEVNRQGTDMDVVEQIFGMAKELQMFKYKAIGVGVPSVVDEKRGIVYDVQNLPAWKEVHLKQLLEEEFCVPAFINNDANCFALGEKYFGKGIGYEHIVGVTVGSGMGAGLILNGRLYSGSNCGAGEVGMLSYRDGVMEYYSSGQFFQRMHGLKGKNVFDLALLGDAMALKMFDEFGTHMAKAIENIIYAYDPEIIIIGGSLKNAYPFYQASMFRALESFPYRQSVQKLKIEISDTENIAVLGAAALALSSIIKY